MVRRIVFNIVVSQNGIHLGPHEMGEVVFEDGEDLSYHLGLLIDKLFPSEFFNTDYYSNFDYRSKSITVELVSNYMTIDPFQILFDRIGKSNGLFAIFEYDVLIQPNLIQDDDDDDDLDYKIPESE